MSLILEALKKSEQQRRLGETPTLGSPVLAASGRRNWLPLIGLMIVVAVAIGWWLLRPAPDRAAIPTTVIATPVAPTAPPMTRIRPDPAPRAAPPKRELANPDTGMGLPAVAPPLPITPPTTDRPGSVTSLPVPPAAAPPAAPVPVPHATPQSSNAPASTAVVPAPARMPPAAEPSTPTAPVAGAPHPSPPATTAPAAPVLPSVWDLPYATRKALPDLSLTMHVYTPDPKQRFVVIKGERHVEGDDLGDGVTLREIRVDGMVLDYKGTRFLYPRSGG